MSVDNGVLYPMDPPLGMVRDIEQAAESAPLVVITAVFFPLATLCMVIRVYTRAFIVCKLSFDDCELIYALKLRLLIWNRSYDSFLGTMGLT
jgi:hypothetical protein